ncbi:hypothetical protein ANANG_G00182970 [Anguilla anguilla]|uniref:RBR-type E3 ubiquitin transferase n=1 Tax=Anguilla anguilla TaxID=7936 RepID=A0A9D3M5M7_ANGAN|nr:hypothetical protein ANANG_G00182970 [Anguilla anguilla]
MRSLLQDSPFPLPSPAHVHAPSFPRPPRRAPARRGRDEPGHGVGAGPAQKAPKSAASRSTRSSAARALRRARDPPPPPVAAVEPAACGGRPLGAGADRGSALPGRGGAGSGRGLALPGSAAAPSSSSSASSSSGGGAAGAACPLAGGAAGVPAVPAAPPAGALPDIMTCPHRSCADCLRQYLRIEVSESRVNISCPEMRGVHAPPLARRRPGLPLVPRPDCGYAVIAFGCASCPKITCGREGCGTEFCYHCKQLWHPNQTCDAARQQRAQSLRLRTVRSSSLSFSQESGATADDIKPCPRCAAYIIKMNDGSCNHMTCAVCGCEFCWLCMKEISDLHYLSPSGCTFWGKKPWSRKKKILWQLGTLVGAPVGIALIAGIAIPAMIIGIPVYVGRKIYNRYEGKDISKHKRNLVIAGGVTLSVIVSPVVAAVTVGKSENFSPDLMKNRGMMGGPAVNTCSYRRGCGVSAGNGKGVRIEFDDENDMNAGGGVAATDSTSVAETRNNPSIGEGSVGGLTGSLSASGSHMERIGGMRDNLSENASTMALAGASITGSLCGSALGGCYNRLEVQADIQKERCSLSGESGTVSLGTISDNASTRAMAGSILNSYTPLDRDGNSMEVQVDIESKPGKIRHHSGGSSVDDGGGRGGGGAYASGCPAEGRRGSAKWVKEPSSSSSSSSGRRARGSCGSGAGGGGAGGGEDADARLLRRRRSGDSSGPDSPSLSDSVPSVAESLSGSRPRRPHAPRPRPCPAHRPAPSAPCPRGVAWRSGASGPFLGASLDMRREERSGQSVAALAVTPQVRLWGALWFRSTAVPPPSTQKPPQ